MHVVQHDQERAREACHQLREEREYFLTTVPGETSNLTSLLVCCPTACELVRGGVKRVMQRVM